MSVDYRCRGTHRHGTRVALRPAPSVLVPVAVAAWVVGCGDNEPRSPAAVGGMPDLTVDVGSTESVGLAEYFSDPDGDELSYAASSSNAEVATVAISGDSVAVTGVAIGSAEITVTASDGSSSASQDFTASVRLTDRQVLGILYDEMGGDGWYDNTNWKTGKPLDEWHGVSTNADGRVDSLHVESNRLTGEIPPELGYLSNLEWLDLTFNFLSGAVPPELENLPDLGFLSLHANSLTGEIPPELGSLSNLTSLFLGNNLLTGEIPPELGDLSSLESLDLHGNSLTGEIPSQLGDLSSLESLDLRGNSLTGEVPPELGDLSKLERLDLYNNSLTGEIPPELGDLSNIQRLDLHANLLTGEIPLDFLDLSSLGRFTWGSNDGLCAPDTTEFDDWLDGLAAWSGPRCD